MDKEKKYSAQEEGWRHIINIVKEYNKLLRRDGLQVLLSSDHLHISKASHIQCISILGSDID